MAKPHHHAPLLAPRSVALVGASPKPGSIGNDMVRVLRGGGFAGAIHPVNPKSAEPKYTEIDGLACHASCAALPEAPDPALLGVGPERLEAAFDEAVAAGARAVAIFASLAYPAGPAPGLRPAGNQGPRRRRAGAGWQLHGVL